MTKCTPCCNRQQGQRRERTSSEITGSSSILLELLARRMEAEPPDAMPSSAGGARPTLGREHAKTTAGDTFESPAKIFHNRPMGGAKGNGELKETRFLSPACVHLCSSVAKSLHPLREDSCPFVVKKEFLCDLCGLGSTALTAGCDLCVSHLFLVIGCWLLVTGHLLPSKCPSDNRA